MSKPRPAARADSRDSVRSRSAIDRAGRRAGLEQPRRARRGQKPAAERRRPIVAQVGRNDPSVGADVAPASASTAALCVQTAGRSSSNTTVPSGQASRNERVSTRHQEHDLADVTIRTSPRASRRSTASQDERSTLSGASFLQPRPAYLPSELRGPGVCRSMRRLVWSPGPGPRLSSDAPPAPRPFPLDAPAREAVMAAPFHGDSPVQGTPRPAIWSSSGAIVSAWHQPPSTPALRRSTGRLPRPTAPASARPRTRPRPAWSGAARPDPRSCDDPGRGDAAAERAPPRPPRCRA